MKQSPPVIVLFLSRMQGRAQPLGKRAWVVFRLAMVSSSLMSARDRARVEELRNKEKKIAVNKKGNILSKREEPNEERKGRDIWFIEVLCVISM